jgi:hypothetical protein
LISCHPPLIVVATTTLGQGVNLGIASVIVAGTTIGHNNPLGKRDFWNICGRAGRAFVDGEGKILFAIDQGPTRDAYDVKQDENEADDYFNRGAMERAESGLLGIVSLLREIALKTGVTFDNLIEMAANDQFDELGDDRDKVEERLDWIDDQLLAMHEAHTNAEDAAEWVDDAFRDSLAAIQERAAGVEPGVVKFLKYRLKGLLGKVPTAEARRAIIASGLPFAVGVAAFRDLDHFRGLIDVYNASGQTLADLSGLVAEIENWARVNARTMFRNLPDADTLENVRPDWLNGLPLTEIARSHGRALSNACLQVFGYQLPWLINAIAQNFDKTTERDAESCSTIGGIRAVD